MIILANSFNVLSVFCYYYFNDDLKGYIMNCLNGEGIYILLSRRLCQLFFYKQQVVGWYRTIPNHALKKQLVTI